MFMDRLPVDDFGEAERILQLCIERLLKKCAHEIWMVRNEETLDNKRSVPNWGKRTTNMARSILTELPNRRLMVMDS
jgi:hypothetical protein